MRMEDYSRSLWQPRCSDQIYQTTPESKRPQRKMRGRNMTKEKLITSEFKPQSLVINDHNGDDTTLVWCPKFYDHDPPEVLPPFPFQVYLTHGARETIEDIPRFAERFACFVEWIGGVPHHLPDNVFNHSSIDDCGSRNFRDGAEQCHYRFEVYSKPQSNILACVAHQRREVRHRNRNAIWPRLVSRWSALDRGYVGRIIVIDRDNWEDAGVVVVGFDPVQYESPATYDEWNVAVDGDHNVVETHLVGAKSILRERLRSYWMDAGHTWTEKDLTRRNAGAVSPVLYPAVDPAAHYDAEYEDVHELDGTPLPVLAAQQGVSSTNSWKTEIVGLFDKDELFKRGMELKYLRSESYSDDFGLPVTSVWNPGLSNLRAPFSITIYLSFDMIPIESKALFNCLNKGLISQGAWTLDVIRNMPSLEAAFDYHSRASTRRTRARTSRKCAVTKILLHKVADERLPTELLDYIEELIVPPEIPNYSGGGARPFREVFMYLDSSSLQSGPLLIYSNPTSFSPDIESAKGIFSDPERWSSIALREHASMSPLLQVTNLRYWHRVADEIHILWSFSSPRLEIAAANMPCISLTMLVPEEIRQRRAMEIQGHIYIELHSSIPITVPQVCFSHSFAEAFEIVDLETNVSLPPIPFEPLKFNSSLDSWSQHRELGFREERFFTLRPISDEGKFTGVQENLPTGATFEELIHDASWLVDGHRYRLNLRPGITVPRWTYGTQEERSGFNLPPIPVVMSEDSQQIFRYVGDSE